jgi:hypothetical protein
MQDNHTVTCDAEKTSIEDRMSGYWHNYYKVGEHNFPAEAFEKIFEPCDTPASDLELLAAHTDDAVVAKGRLMMVLKGRSYLELS